MKNSISIKSILASMIKSIDSYNYLLKEHHKHTAIIAYQLANAYGLPKKDIDTLVLAASLHDIGALHIRERDQLISMDIEDVKRHQSIGYIMLKDFKPFSEISKIVKYHHINYKDLLEYDLDEQVIKSCYLLHLADRIDILRMKSKAKENVKTYVIEELGKKFGYIFPEDYKETFYKVTANPEFWRNIELQSFHDLLLLSIDEQKLELNEVDLEQLAILFARIVDFKSHWTMTHSLTVGHVAGILASMLGLDANDKFEVKIAGFLHDIGKIAVPTELLEKPGKLTEEEFNEVRNHAMYSALILSPIKDLDNICRLAASHHEKRDRSGYPLKPDLSTFSIQMDIVAFSDIFCALNEDRPYRQAMNKEQVIQTLEEYDSEKLDERVRETIISNIDGLTELFKDIQMLYQFEYVS